MGLAPTMRPGPLNLLTDVAGLRVGQAHDERLASGVTVVLFDEPAVAGVAIVGGAPAGRDQECLEPHRTVAGIDALVLSGGSGFGLDAASGAQAWLRERGRGLPVRDIRVPIVPSAILFDLLNGGDKGWGRYPPYRELAYAACEAIGVPGPTGAVDRNFALGTVGAGYGATTVDLKGGLGSASVVTTAGHTVGAIAAVNALGSAVIDGGPHFWAAPFEFDREFGGLGWPDRPAGRPPNLRWKGGPAPATTLAIVATDAALDKGQAKAVALAASTGLAKSLRLSQAAMDGDTVFAASTGQRTLSADSGDLIELMALASDCLARAVARGIYAARRLPFQGSLDDWQNTYSSQLSSKDS